jgi:hypothetical protein
MAAFCHIGPQQFKDTMDNHFIVLFDDIAYADRFAATSPRLFSSHPQARELEEELKREHPSFADIWPKIEALPAPERNFITAVFLAWAYQGAFYDALASGKLPKEIFTCQDAGSDDGGYYYNYEYSPARCREMFLKERLDFAQRDVRHFSEQLKRLQAEETADEATA